MLANILLNIVGTVVEIDDPLKTGGGSRHYLRARVVVNVRKPLWSGRWLKKPNAEKVWVHFKYERLQGLCYNCRVFGHEHKHCKSPRVMAANNKDLPKYGPFLTASKPRWFQGVPFGDAYKESEKFKQDEQCETQSECGSSHMPSKNDEESAGNEAMVNTATVNNEGVSVPQVDAQFPSTVVSQIPKGVTESINLPTGTRVIQKFA